MVIIDVFSRRVNLYALKERTAENAGSKEEQAIVERANKEVMRHLRNFIFDHDALWSY